MAAKIERLMTTAAFARELGVTPAAVRRWVRDGVISPRQTTSGTGVYRDEDVRAARAYQNRRATAA